MKKPDLWNGMTHKQFMALGSYIRELANLMHLYDWTLVLLHEPLPMEEGEQCQPLAQVVPTPHRKHASVQVSRAFMDQDPETIRECLVHELVHCGFSMLKDLVRLGLKEELGGSGYTLFYEAFRQNEECAVDWVADTLAPHMPPFIVKGKKKNGAA